MILRRMMLDVAESQLISKGTHHTFDPADDVVEELVQELALFGHVNEQPYCLAALPG
ncbi:hypothetical protein D3C81_2190840 [compost metagenome]